MTCRPRNWECVSMVSRLQSLPWGCWLVWWEVEHACILNAKTENRGLVEDWTGWPRGASTTSSRLLSHTARPPGDACMSTSIPARLEKGTSNAWLGQALRTGLLVFLVLHRAGLHCATPYRIRVSKPCMPWAAWSRRRQLVELQVGV